MNRFEYVQWGAKATAAKGNRLPHAKLDAEKVKEIRANRKGLTMKQQAALYNVHPRTIQNVRYFESWVHV
jgi:DNA-binding transcriptional regulator YiaG